MSHTLNLLPNKSKVHACYPISQIFHADRPPIWYVCHMLGKQFVNSLAWHFCSMRWISYISLDFRFSWACWPRWQALHSYTTCKYSRWAIWHFQSSLYRRQSGPLSNHIFRGLWQKKKIWKILQRVVMVWKFAPKWPLEATVKAFRNRCQSRWRINVPATAVYSVDKAERRGQVRAMVVPFSSLAPLWSILSTLLLSSKVDIMVPGVGRLRGTTIRSTESRRPIHSFWGVPYAEPPTHSLRFDG